MQGSNMLTIKSIVLFILDKQNYPNALLFITSLKRKGNTIPSKQKDNSCFYESSLKSTLYLQVH